MCHLTLELRHLLGQLGLEGLRKAGEQTGSLLQVLSVPHLQGHGHHGDTFIIRKHLKSVLLFLLFYEASAFYFNSKSANETQRCKEIWPWRCCQWSRFLSSRLGLCCMSCVSCCDIDLVLNTTLCTSTSQGQLFRFDVCCRTNCFLQESKVTRGERSINKHFEGEFVL